jgi:hypothetical protein
MILESKAPRQTLLRQSFSNLPKQIGPFALRPLSGGSFELLHDIQNPLVFGASEQRMDIKLLLSAVHEFIYVHTADLDLVSAINSRDDIDPKEIRKISMQIEIGECLELTTLFAECSLRMAAAMSEPDADDDSAPGKPQMLRTGSPLSSSPAEPLETPSASDTSSGSLPSTERSNTSTPQPCNQEPDAVGVTPLFALPNPQTLETIPSDSHSPPSDPDSPQI